jgi:hypothetical protein
MQPDDHCASRVSINLYREFPLGHSANHIISNYHSKYKALRFETFHLPCLGVMVVLAAAVGVGELHPLLLGLSRPSGNGKTNALAVTRLRHSSFAGTLRGLAFGRTRNF